MYCKNCGNEMDVNAVVCVKCGVAKGVGNAFCSNCGQEIKLGSAFCLKCGVATNSYVPNTRQPQSRVLVGVLGIFFGTLGVHNFMLGYTNKGIIQVLLTIIGSIFTFGLTAIAVGVWALVESIQILAGNVQVDAYGIPLKD